MADLEGDETPCYPEEVYLAPPLDDSLKTETLMRCKKRQTCHVVMTPACDLVIRAGCKPKSEVVVVVAEIVPETDLFAKLQADKGWKNNLKRNNDAKCFHWLPRCHTHSGGFVDFRRLETVMWDKLDEKFDRLEARIAPSFIKDVVSRFSASYARQGQPDIDVPSG